MPWTDDEFSRSRADLVARVRARGSRLRRRHRLVASTVVPLAVLSIVIPAGLAMRRSDNGRTTLSAASAAARSSTSASPFGFQPTTTLAIPPGVTGTTTPVISITPLPLLSNGEPRATTTTLVPPVTSIPSTTVPEGATATTVPPPSTIPETTTTSQPGAPACDPSKFTLSPTTTGKTTYMPGETVNAKATLTNGNDGPCAYMASYRSLIVRDASGADVSVVTLVIDYLAMPTLQPGEEIKADMPWGQMRTSAPGGQAPPGVYTVMIKFNDLQTAPATVELVGS